MGINRVPFLHKGISCFTPKCLQAQFVITYATPTFGLMVVKGKFPIDTVLQWLQKKKLISQR